MDYETVKKLKNKGFPQPKEEPFSGHYEHKNPGALGEYFYSPTLSELIEACGDGFEYLNKVHGGGWVAGTKDTPMEGTLGASNFEHAKTPEGAVARLWLALNPKS